MRMARDVQTASATARMVIAAKGPIDDATREAMRLDIHASALLHLPRIFSTLVCKERKYEAPSLRRPPADLLHERVDDVAVVHADAGWRL